MRGRRGRRDRAPGTPRGGGAAEDRVALLHDFLHALLLLAQVDGFLVEGVEVTAIDDGSLRAVVAGEPVDPVRHRLHGEVKARHLARAVGRATATAPGVPRVILDV